MPENKQAQIKQILTKAVDKIYPSPEFLEQKLKQDKKLTIYQGFDPTGNSLHIGHSVGLIKLKQFQDMGHKVIFLIGDYTAMIGDPDKKSARKSLTREQVLDNCKDYRKQAEKIVDFKGKNPVELRYNSSWHSKLNFDDILKLLANFTVQRMLERDLFEQRIKSGNPLYLHEFMYPVMQAYDSVEMEVDGEIGGSDQTFNMLQGRDLSKTLKNKDKFVLTTKLLEDPTGRKMGKTEGNMVRLDDNPGEMFGKIMSWPDTMIALGYELCTLTSVEKVSQVKKLLNQPNTNPKDLKTDLAMEIVSIHHSSKRAEAAKNEFNKIFSHKELPDVIDKLLVMDIEYNIIDLIMLAELAPSKSEAKRLVEQGGVKLDGDTIKNWNHNIKPKDNSVLKVGKRKFVKLILRQQENE